MAEGQVVVVDEGKMIDKIMDFPKQLEQAWTGLWTKELPSVNIDRVLISGMGGSGVPGLLVKDLFSRTSKVPLDTWSDYELPGYVNEKTLLIAVSYSGDTEEVIDGIKVALEKKVPIFAVGSGGKLEELAQIHGFTFLKVEATYLPREELGMLFGIVLTLLAKLQVIDLSEKNYFSALEELKSVIQHKLFPGKAEQLAINLNNKVPIFFAYSPLQAVAKRWVNQINENAKALAIVQNLPEGCHNTIVGIDFPIPEKIVVIILESTYGYSRNIARKKILQKLFEDKEVGFVPLSVKSGSPLAEQFLLLHFGDLLSYSLAGVYGVDPTPIEAIDFLKEGLKKL